jgi:hypothetical protein
MSKPKQGSSFEGRPTAPIKRLAADAPSRTPGSAQGLISIADDFDAPMPDLEQAFEE